ncbi:MAG: M14 family zinc carboxypeptidase, partial [Gemmatimonadota bacterium]
YGVHGNESSSSEAAIWTAWDLASGASEVAGVLDSAVVVIDPAANPDGRDRYVNHFNAASGRSLNTNVEARERREPWPGGRFNHYLFDLNRDWAWLSQPETRARHATWSRWNPQMHVDFHEMGYRSSYFFFPAAKPVNTLFPRHTLEWGERFGEANARAFDERGWLYFTAENYDLFYPGYGDSWPSLTGAIGMTYEQGGGGFAGLGVERPDGTTLTLADRAMGHRTTGQATLRTAASGKTALMSGFADFHRNVDDGLSDILLVAGAASARTDALVRFLLDQGIRVERTGTSFSTGATPHPGFESRSSFPAGTYRVPARQPRGRLAYALLRAEHELIGDGTYDITAWSLPYAYGVEAHSAGAGAGGGWEAVERPAGAALARATGSPGAGGSAPAAPADTGSYGYLLPPDFAAAPGLVRFLADGGVAYVLSDTFRLGGRDYRRGTIFLPQSRNEGLDRRVAEADLAEHLVPIRTGATENGPNLGTGGASPLKLPRVGLLGGEGTSATSFGAHWFFLEDRLELPFDAIEAGSVGSLALDAYDVLLVPSTGGSFRGVVGERGMESIEAWVRAGGTLIAVAGGARAVGESLAGVAMRTELDEDEPDRDARLERALRDREERAAERWSEQTPGAILRMALDPRHPIGFGAGTDVGEGESFVLSLGASFEPDESWESVGYFPAGLTTIAGIMSDRNLERMSRSAWLAHANVGQGNVVLFADDPVFRMFWYSGFQLYANAILYAPAY